MSFNSSLPTWLAIRIFRCYRTQKVISFPWMAIRGQTTAKSCCYCCFEQNNSLSVVQVELSITSLFQYLLSMFAGKPTRNGKTEQPQDYPTGSEASQIAENGNGTSLNSFQFWCKRTAPPKEKWSKFRELKLKFALKFAVKLHFSKKQHIWL